MTTELTPDPSTDHVTPADVQSEGLTSEALSPTQQAFRRYWKHRGAAVSTVVFVIIAVAALLAPLLARYGVSELVETNDGGANQNLSPRSEAWLGTDRNGFDVYSRLLYGVRTSVFIGIASAILSVLFGTTVGAIAGMKGKQVDNLMMRFTDLNLAFPFLVSVILVRQFLGGIEFIQPVIGDRTSIRFIIVLFAVFGWMLVARLVRSQILALKEREFVEAARAAGASNFRIVVTHLLPNSIGPIIVALTLGVTAAIIGESTLSFFGFGPQPGQGTTSLGKLIEGSGDAARAGYWWLVVFPGGALVLLAVCINFMGDGLRDAFDPKLDGGR